MTILKVLGAFALATVACVLALFYVSYGFNPQTSIFSWPVSSDVYERVLVIQANKKVKAPVPTFIFIPSNIQVADLWKRHSNNPANGCHLKDVNAYNQMEIWERFVYNYNPLNFVCRKPWIAPKQRKVMRVEPGATYEQGLVWARENVAWPRIGLVPSEMSAGSRPSSSATARSLWLGIITPILLIFGALALLIWAVGSRVRSRKRTAPAQEVVPPPTRSRASKPALVRLLRDHFGADFPVESGSATREDPLVISERIDYVSLEYAIAKFLMSGEEFKKEKQVLLNLDGRKVDELVYTTKTPDAPEWQRTRNFYFDITAGFDRLGQ